MHRQLFRKVALLTVIPFLIIFILTPFTVKAELYLTPEEQEYITQSRVLKAASIDGAAPLHYRDSKGNIKGIAVNVLDEIAEITGLIIEYHLYSSINDAVNSAPDFLFGVTTQYAPPGVILSKPYLESETILYYNSVQDPKQLDNKRHAAIQGGTLPEGIKEENTIYFNNREETMNAVETGKADYGYSNAYSLAFYMLQNNYKNIITIPTGIEERAYCIGLMKEDNILLSIINKSIETIGESRMQTLILDVASQIERKITLDMILDTYGSEIFWIALLIVFMLSSAVYYNVWVKRELVLQNKRYELLSHTSNECIFDYSVPSGRLTLSEKCRKIFKTDTKLAEIEGLLKEFLLHDNSNFKEKSSRISLSFDDGTVKIFNIINSSIKDNSGNTVSIIGKLTDISAEVAEKEQLVTLTQTDGLTGLYNAVTTKRLIAQNMKNRDSAKTDALILIDGDNFKSINDTYGHLIGDRVLENISKSLRLTFRENDIIGRIGGDEFCVYLPNVPSVDFVRTRCEQLGNLIQELNEDVSVFVSIGIALLSGEEAHRESYEDTFKKAETAVYQSKRKGGAKVIIYQELTQQDLPR